MVPFIKKSEKNMFKGKKYHLSQEVIDLVKNAKKNQFLGFRTESEVVEHILRDRLTIKKTQANAERLIEAAGKIT
tara:strand:+ start:227 stop:451 length:225 start_codon:yes stop_codon:yes gene_type:complete